MSNKAVIIEIKTTADLRAAKLVEAELQKQIIAAKAAGVAHGKLSDQLKAVQGGIAAKGFAGRAGSGIMGLAEKVPVLGSAMRSLNGGVGVWSTIAAGASAAAVAVGACIRAFSASEVEMAKLDAALANSGQLTDDYREKLSKLATERSGKTGIDDEKYVGVFTTLTKFGADTSNIDTYTRAVENLAGFMGGDLEQAAFLFGKAMQGSTKMLGRYGIQVDGSKSKSEQLASIMTQLEARGGGQLEAMGATMQGSFNKAANAWENLLESMGSAAEKSGITKIIAQWAADLQLVAGMLGGDSKPTSKNRTRLVADRPEEQETADRLDAKRKEIEAAREAARAFGYEAANKEADAWLPGSRKKWGSEKRLREDQVRNFDAQLAGLDVVESTYGFRREAAAPAGEKEVGTMLGPTPEEVAQGQAAAKARVTNSNQPSLAEFEQVKAKRESLALELEIAEARASGNTAELERLEWMREYTRLLQEAKAAGIAPDDAYAGAIRGANAKGTPDASKESRGSAIPTADRLTQIGGYNGASAQRQTSERSLDSIARATERTARATEDLSKKPDPTPATTSVF